MTSIKGTIRAFCAPKEWDFPDEYEDAYSWMPGEGKITEFDTDTLNVAIADGASASSLAGPWASRLTSGFVSAPAGTGLDVVIVDAAAGWRDYIAGYRAARAASTTPIRFYEERKLGQGSFATIVGFRLWAALAAAAEEEAGPAGEAAEAGDEPVPLTIEGRYEAWAVGDACVLQVRGDRLLASFPLKEAAEFGLTPGLAGSHPLALRALPDDIRHVEGSWEQGDVFYLATDAVARWILVAATSDDPPWSVLDGLERGPGDAFGAWVTELRAARVLGVDDSTLICLRPGW